VTMAHFPPGRGDPDKTVTLAEAAGMYELTLDCLLGWAGDGTITRDGTRDGTPLFSRASIDAALGPYIYGPGDRCDPGLPDAQSPVPHDYEDLNDDEYGSLADGGSYRRLRCRRPWCRRPAYDPLPD
jgi:hypothetical protein